VLSRNLQQLCCCILVCFAALYGQSTGNCTLRGEPLDSTISSKALARSPVTCLDINGLDGQTIQVPSNVRRIDSRGIALCPANTLDSVMYPPAIVFILDQSTSMENGGGDPNGQRALVIRNAIKQFYNTAHAGWFSYIEFAGDVKQALTQSTDSTNVYYVNTGADSLLSADFMPLDQSHVDLWSSNTSPVQRRAHTNTNYVAPLRQAKQYINALRADTSKHVGDISIVLISDGEPNTPTATMDTILSVLDSNYEVPGKFVKVHGVFLGQAGTALQTLADSTGGSYQQVNPADSNSLSNVLDSLVQSIALGGTPTSMVISSSGVEYTSLLMTEDTAGGFQVALNRSIPLDSGLNSLAMDIQYILDNGDSATRTLQFNIDVSDAPADSTIFDAGGYFAGYCSAFNIVDVVGLGSDGYPNVLSTDTVPTLTFTFSPAWYSDSTTTLTIRSASTGDLETLVLPASLDSAGLAAYLGNIPLEVTNGTYTLGDSVLQVSTIDTLWFHWVNPKDSTDVMDWRIILGKQQNPYAADYAISVWETDSIGTRLLALADKNSGALYPTDSIAPSALAGPNVLLKILIAGLGSDSMTYTLIGGDTTHFRLVGDTLVLAAGLDYETDTVHTIRYLVRRGSLADTGTIRVSVLDVNEFPFGKTMVVMKDHALVIGDLIDLLTAKDPEGDSLTLRVLNSADGTFHLSGDSLYTDSPLAFVEGAIYTIPIEISDGTRTDTLWVEVHMVSAQGDDLNSNYIRGASYHNGILTVTSGPGLLQIHSLGGDLLATTSLNVDGKQEVVVNLPPGVYIVTVGCAKRMLVVSGK